MEQKWMLMMLEVRSDHKISFGVLGCGHMATALTVGIRNFEKNIIFSLFTPSKTKAQTLALLLDGEVADSLFDFSDCEYFMIACKPHQVEELAISFRKRFPSYKGVLISILAGISTSYLADIFNCKAIIRLMPNTPALVDKGVIAVYITDEVPSLNKKFIVKIFSNNSKFFIFDDENKIDTITPYSGSGPAYIFEMARILTQKLMKEGIEENIAKEMIDATFVGASSLMQKSTDTHEELRNKVTSKNGVTYEALESLREKGLEEILVSSMDRAYNRTIELKK